MAEKDPLQNSINRLDNTMNALDKTVKGLTKAFNDMNRTEKSRKVPLSTEDTFKERLISAFAEVAPLTKKGTPRKDFTLAVEKLLEQHLDTLTKYDKIREYGYNKDNPSNKLSDIYGIKEVQKIVNEMLSDLESKKNGISKDDSKSVRKELFGDNKGVSVDNSYKIIQSMQDNSEVILRTAGVFAQVRSEVANFQNAIKNATNTVSSNLSSNSKKVSNRLEKMASDSKTLKDVLANLNHSLTRANKAVDKFADRLSTATRLVSNNNRRLSGSVTSINSLVKKVQKTTSTINNIQNNLSKKNSGSSYSDNNTFREQATRNSDRAKQAGFIALLIPALAKLFKKTPVTDLFKLLALKLGAGLSGRGEHPVLGAIGLMSAPLISGALFAKPVRDALFSFMGKTATLNKGISTGGKGTLPWSQTGKYFNGFKMGFTSGHLDRVGANADRVSLGMGDFKTDNMGNFIRNKRGERIVVPKSGNVAGGLGYEQGRKLIRNIPRQAKIAGGTLGKAMPWITTALTAGTEFTDGKFTRAAQRGETGLQVAKSIGSVLATALPTAIGFAFGGPAGAALGAIFAPISKGFYDGLVNNLDKKAKQDADNWKDATGWRTGFGAKIIDIAAGIWSGIKELAEPIIGIWNWIKEKFHIGESDHDKDVRLNNEQAFTSIKNKLIREKADLGRAKSKVKDDEAIFKNAIDYKEKGDSGWFGAKKRSYDKLMNRFTQNYIHSKIGDYDNTSGETNIGYKMRYDKYKKEHQNEINSYLEQQWKKYRKTEQGRITAEKARLDKISITDIDTLAKKAVEAQNKAITFSGGSRGLGTFYGHNVTSGWGKRVHPVKGGVRMHNGIDLDFKAGEKVGAYVGGKIAKIGREDGYGNVVVIEEDRNGQKVYHRYAHLQGATKGLKVGQTVGKGSIIGYAGSSGVGTGAHLHYEQRLNSLFGRSVDPRVSLSSNVEDYKKLDKISSEATTAVKTQETASIGEGVRGALKDIVGGTNKSAKQDRTRSIVLSAVDVTGSLGVWGITQLNNGVMKTGR